MFAISCVCHSQVIITVYALSTRRQPYTSSGPSNWTPAALAPGLSWATSTWRWRTLRLPSRPTGQLKAAWRIHSSLYCCESFLVFTCTLSIRHAIEVNKRDYRAWYGLGQTYEILKMPFYCLYYYRKAHQLRYGKKKVFYCRTINIILGTKMC